MGPTGDTPPWNGCRSSQSGQILERELGGNPRKTRSFGAVISDMAETLQELRSASPLPGCASCCWHEDFERRTNDAHLSYLALKTDFSSGRDGYFHSSATLPSERRPHLRTTRLPDCQNILTVWMPRGPWAATTTATFREQAPGPTERM